MAQAIEEAGGHFRLEAMSEGFPLDIVMEGQRIAIEVSYLPHNEVKIPAIGVRDPPRRERGGGGDFLGSVTDPAPLESISV